MYSGPVAALMVDEGIGMTYDGLSRVGGKRKARLLLQGLIVRQMPFKAVGKADLPYLGGR